MACHPYAHRAVVVAVAAIGALACGSHPPTPIAPTPLPGPPPQLLCPSDLGVTIHGSAQAVTFAPPTVTGGTAPVSVTCSPASGASFPLGSTPVSCVAIDAAGASASCAFTVHVTGVQLGVKKFEAIGDSLTEGENGIPQARFTDEPNSYPTKLSLHLEADFPGQGIVVFNRGLGGQRFDGPLGTLELLPGYLATDTPDAVLVVGGYNHLVVPCHFGTRADDPDCAIAVEHAEDALRDVIRFAKTWPGVRYVFVSTLTPPGPIAADAAIDRRIDPSAIADMNERVRFSTALEGGILVDTFAAFVGHEAEYVSVDGLHLRPAGYQTIADLFYARILAIVPQSGALRLR